MGKNKEKLQEENMELKREINRLKEQLTYYEKRDELIDEKEKRIDEMISHLNKQKELYKNVISEAEMLRNQIKEYIK